MNQRARSSVAWFRSFAVCALSTPSRCVCGALAELGMDFFTWFITAVTKFTRSTTVLEEIHESLVGQPFTSGGPKRDWPIPEPAPATSFERLGPPGACPARSMNSSRLLTSALELFPRLDD